MKLSSPDGAGMSVPVFEPLVPQNDWPTRAAVSDWASQTTLASSLALTREGQGQAVHLEIALPSTR